MAAIALGISTSVGVLVRYFLFLHPPHPFLPYVAPHFSHISPFILVFQGNKTHATAERIASAGGVAALRDLSVNASMLAQTDCWHFVAGGGHVVGDCKGSGGEMRVGLCFKKGKSTSSSNNFQKYQHLIYR